MGAPFVSGQSEVRGETHQFVGPAHVTGYSQGAAYETGYQQVGAVQQTTTYGSSALALDAADGVIDGKFYGSQIVGQPGFVQQRSFVTGPAYGATSSALALDAADGVIDGKFFGSQIVGQPGFVQQQRSFVTGPTYGAASSALALDAADGVIDGKFFGANIVGQQRPYGF
jgi:hypothetical protein